MIEPTRASVRPRVVVDGDRVNVLLEEVVSEIVDAGRISRIELRGPRGFGTTTALKHLASVLGSNAGLDFIDSTGCSTNDYQVVTGTVVCSKAEDLLYPAVAQYRLAGWGRDEWIEYLLNAHKNECSSVLARVLVDPDTDTLDGNPTILALVLDELAADAQLPDVKSAISRIVDRHFPTAALQAEMRSFVCQILPLTRDDSAELCKRLIAIELKKKSHLTTKQSLLAAVPAVHLHFATQAAWEELSSTAPPYFFQQLWSRPLVAAVAARLRESPTNQEVLRKWMASRKSPLQAMAVSLLHAVGANWELPKPARTFLGKKANNLDGAILDGSDCREKWLTASSIQAASFQKANLAGLELKNCKATLANFSHADLHKADLDRLIAHDAKFVRTNLSGSYCEEGRFHNADFSLADLQDAQYSYCHFGSAKLRGTNLQRARLTNCDFQNVDLADADFSNCDLTQSNLFCLDLTLATFVQANFREAILSQCNLEYMDLPDADFSDATLTEALLTGSTMPRADLFNADLSNAKLAFVEWENVDLRCADLRGATFHVGASRCGMIDSSIPMEGSRTGFYTDEYQEQDFKAPEEIRKANLRGADLRGANIEGVDFYLVDLRDAKYDSRQAQQLRQTGAILETREV